MWVQGGGGVVESRGVSPAADRDSAEFAQMSEGQGGASRGLRVSSG